MRNTNNDTALSETQAKCVSLDELCPLVEKRKASGKKVVWTNGCFDILHAGHVTYLLRARAHGDVLVVGLNSDASVKENKGEGRPINNEQDRALVLAALSCVDYIVTFSDKSPLPLLEAIQPDVYAKGGDYTLDTIVQEERNLVESYGGKIALLSGVVGASTTNIIERLQGAS
jgi:rfaE bifunctional protein nucleotidyltransferase chain/domain